MSFVTNVRQDELLDRISRTCAPLKAAVLCDLLEMRLTVLKMPRLWLIADVVGRSDFQKLSIILTI